MLSVFPSSPPPPHKPPFLPSSPLRWDETTPSGNTFPFKGTLHQAAYTLWEATALHGD